MDKSYKYDRARIINKLFSVKKTGMVMVEQTSKGNLSFKWVKKKRTFYKKKKEKRKGPCSTESSLYNNGYFPKIIALINVLAIVVV